MKGPLTSRGAAALYVRGRAIAPGTACGPLRRNKPDLSAAEAEGAVLLAERAVPDDVGRILAAAGTLTLSGAVLSHVSLLSREFGKPSVSLVGVTPARFGGEDEAGLLVFEDVVGADGPAALEEGDIVLLDGTRGYVALPCGLDAASRATARRVFIPLAAYGKLPADPALLDAVLAACPPDDETALAFVLDAALVYRRTPPGRPSRALLEALRRREGADGGRIGALLSRLADSVIDDAGERCRRAEEDLARVEDLGELQRSLRRFEAALERALRLLEDVGADPDRLEQRLEPVLVAAGARGKLLETRLAEEVERALALSEDALATRLGGLFRLLRRARAAHLDPESVGALHRRLTQRLAEERARSGAHLTVPLIAGAPRDRALVGGKAAGILEVVDALPRGCHVPPGFVVTAAAYRLHLLGETGERLRLALEADDESEVSRKARAAILAGDIPEEVVEAMRDAFGRLRAGRLAVRSSATIEDGPVGSLAGLFDTYLGADGFDDLVERVRWAWASLWNARALAALSASGQSPLRASLAVLVQELVPTRAAGVLFSRDPSGRPDTLLVNASWGLGEGISQGETPGDLYWVRRSSGETLASETGLARFRIELAPRGIGTVEVPLSPGERERGCLTGPELARLAELARRLEEVTGRAQDIEFGFEPDGDLVLFQVRRVVPRRSD